jgi:hypothetical protein
MWHQLTMEDEVLQEATRRAWLDREAYELDPGDGEFSPRGQRLAG